MILGFALRHGLLILTAEVSLICPSLALVLVSSKSSSQAPTMVTCLSQVLKASNPIPALIRNRYFQLRLQSIVRVGEQNLQKGLFEHKQRNPFQSGFHFWWDGRLKMGPFAAFGFPKRVPLPRGSIHLPVLVTPSDRSKQPSGSNVAV